MVFRKPQTSWRNYRHDPVGFARSFLRWDGLNEEHCDHLSDLAHCPERMGITSITFDFWGFSACVALWKAFCWRQSSTIIVVSRQSVGAMWMMHAETILAKSVIGIRQEILIAKNKSAICLKENGDAWAIAHAEPRALDTEACKALAGSPLTLILPSLSAVPTPHIRDACEMLHKGDLLLVDEPPVC